MKFGMFFVLVCTAEVLLFSTMSHAAPAPDPFVGKVLDNFLGLAGRTVGHVGQTIGHVGQSVGSLFETIGGRPASQNRPVGYPQPQIYNPYPQPQIYIPDPQPQIYNPDPRPQMSCDYWCREDYSPVCGKDVRGLAKTYANQCILELANCRAEQIRNRVLFAHSGECGTYSGPSYGRRSLDTNEPMNQIIE
jgi:hypothetical protein